MPELKEQTILTPAEETAFQQWIQENKNAPGIRDYYLAPYDMRGFWQDKKALSQWKPGSHFPDTYKQHGHESFSQESKYSSGPSDGGMWIGGETFLAQPRLAPAHLSAIEQLLLTRGGR